MSLPLYDYILYQFLKIFLKRFRHEGFQILRSHKENGIRSSRSDHHANNAAICLIHNGKLYET